MKKNKKYRGVSPGIFPAIAILALAALLASCENKRTRGYSETGTGLLYKLHSFDSETCRPGRDDFAEIRLVCMTEADSVFYDSANRTFRSGTFLKTGYSSFRGSFEEGLQRMSPGDSMTFLVNSDSFFLKYVRSPVPWFFKKGDFVKIGVKMMDIYSPEDFEKRMAELKLQEQDRDMEELKSLYRYIKERHPGNQADTSGIYFIPLKEGKGKMAGQGKKVIVKYSGCFLNGLVFDRMATIEFKLGEQGQVIPGLEMGIKKMKEGDEAKIIIPSYLGFGKEGSSTGIVPPYQTLVYNVELLKVK